MRVPFLLAPPPPPSSEIKYAPDEHPGLLGHARIVRRELISREFARKVVSDFIPSHSWGKPVSREESFSPQHASRNLARGRLLTTRGASSRWIATERLRRVLHYLAKFLRKIPSCEYASVLSTRRATTLSITATARVSLFLFASSRMYAARTGRRSGIWGLLRESSEIFHGFHAKAPRASSIFST